MKTLIELYGGPGAGKSTIAAGLFYLLKMGGHNAELCREYAKDLTWDGSIEFAEQEDILEEQMRRERELLDSEASIIVTDSPILQSTVYGSSPETIYSHYAQHSDDLRIIRVFIARDRSTYSQLGRTQLVETPTKLDLEILQLMETHEVLTKNDNLQLFIENHICNTK